MRRRILPLTGDVWDAIAAPCRTCLFWELGEPPSDGDPERQAIRKQAWTTARLHEGAAPGRAVQVDGEVVGVAVFAPVRDLARRPGGMPAPHDDALVLATIWVDPLHRNRGLGRLLVQQAIKDAIRRRLAAVEVRADRRWRPDSCVLPITWLLHEGFEVVDEHVRWPLLRLEVARTVRWADSVEHAVEEVRGLLPGRSVAPRPVVEAAVGASVSAVGPPPRDPREHPPHAP